MTKSGRSLRNESGREVFQKRQPAGDLPETTKDGRPPRNDKGRGAFAETTKGGRRPRNDKGRETSPKRHRENFPKQQKGGRLLRNDRREGDLSETTARAGDLSETTKGGRPFRNDKWTEDCPQRQREGGLSEMRKDGRPPRNGRWKQHSAGEVSRQRQRAICPSAKTKVRRLLRNNKRREAFPKRHRTGGLQKIYKTIRKYKKSMKNNEHYKKTC